MQKLKYLILLLVSLASPAFAVDAVPSDESIRQLLEVTDARKLVEGMMNQMDGVMRNTMQQSLQGKTVTPEQQQIIDDMRSKTVALMKKELGWDNLEPIYLRIYRDSFTQEEIDGMLALYRTPAGQALVKKMPVVMQRSALEMQGRMETLMRELRKIQQESLRELKALPRR